MNKNNKRRILIILIMLLLIPSIIIGGNKVYSNIVHKENYKASTSPWYDTLKVSSLKITERKTGAAPFDTSTTESVDDGSVLSNMDGIDVSDKDDYLRTFDILSYTLEVGVDLNLDSGIEPGTIIKGGVIKVKATFPKNAKGEVQAMWLRDSWMIGCSRNEDNTVITAQYSIPSDMSLVGGTQELTFNAIAYGYENEILEDDSKPTFEVWIEGNKPDNENSSADSAVIIDNNNLHITGINNNSISIYKGIADYINVPMEKDGVEGNYVNFSLELNMNSKNERNFSGILLPNFSDISAILDLKYYYNDLNSPTGWTLIDENNTKANGVLNGTEIIAYNLFGVKNPAAKPSAQSNYGDESTSSRFENISKKFAGDLDFENVYLDGNFLNLDFSNYSYSTNLRDDVNYTNTNINELSEDDDAKLFSVMIELFIPYYDPNGSNYDYRFDILIKDAKSSTNGENTESIQFNSREKFSITLEQNMENLMKASLDGFDNSFVIGGELKYTSKFGSSYSPLEGGVERLISWESSLADFSGVEASYYKEDYYIKYGVNKNNPLEGLLDLESVNSANKEDFLWFDSIEDANKNGKISAVIIDTPYCNGGNETCEFYIKFTLHPNPDNILKTHFARQKTYVYLDEQRQNRIDVYASDNTNSYSPDVYEDGFIVSTETPKPAGHTYLIHGNLIDKEINTNKKIYDINDEIVNVTVNLNDRVDLISKGVYLLDDILGIVTIDSGLSYLEGSANIEPEFVDYADDGKLYLGFIFKDHYIGEEIPTINFDLVINPLLENNIKKSIYIKTSSLKRSPLDNQVTYKINGNNKIIKTNSSGSSGITITITNLSGSSVRKSTSKKYLETNETIEIKDGLFNVSNKQLSNVKTIQQLPKNNDIYGSNFKGEYKVKVLSIADEQKIYYTTKDISELNIIKNENNILSAANTDFANDPNWIEVQINGEIPYEATFIGSTYNTLETLTSKETKYEFIPTNNSVYDSYYFRVFMTSDNLTSVSTSAIKSIGVGDRGVSGVVFIDKNDNDVYDTGDELYNNFKIKLLDTNKNIITETTTNTNGKYEIKGLSKKDYYLQIDLSENYEIVKKAAGGNKNSNVFNSDGFSDLISELNDDLRVNYLLSSDNNLGLKIKEGILIVNHYIEGTTNELAPKETTTLYWGSSYTTTPSNKVSSNYELVDTPNNASGTISGDVVVNYYYRLKSAKLTVHHYIEGTTDELAATENYDKKWTDEYTTSPSDKVSVNYELVSTPSNASGTISGDVVVKYYYRLKSAKLTVHHYIEGTTDELADTENYDKKWTDEYTTKPSNTVDKNYELVSTPNNASGTISGDVVVTYYYRLKSATITINYYIEDTTTKLGESVIKEVHWGDEYSTDPLSNVSVNYELVSTPENASGTISGDVVVNYYYRLKSAKLIVHHYIEGTTKELSATENYDKKWTDEYTTSPSNKVSVNYELVDTPSNASGIISGDVTVVYYYRLKSAKLIVHHYIEGTTDELTDTESYDKKWTDEYTTSPSDKVSVNYELVGTPQNASGIVSGDVVVNYYYRLKSAKLIVHHYIEGTTDKLADTENYDKKWTDEYTTKPSDKVSVNYELVDTPSNASGIISGDVTVVYYYRLKSAKLIVHHYIEGTTDELTDTESYDKKWTDEYTTSPSDKISVNYELVATPENAAGTISGDVIVNYYYKLKSATITINYYIQDTTTKLGESIIKDVHWGDEYSTDPLSNVSVNYELVGTPQNAAGIVSGDVVVNYYYRLKGASLTVHHYIEGTTNELADSTTKQVHWGDNYTTEPSDKIDNNYELVSTPENASGTISGDVVVTYYYKLKSAKLIVHHYIEGTTKELAATENYDKKWTDEYTTKPSDKVSVNYELVSTPENASGTISGDVVVTYYYKLKSAKLIVHHYIEGTTKELAATENYDKKWTDEYTTKPSDKVSVNYELVATPENASGTISGDVVVTYYYRLKSATITINYYIEDTTTKLGESIIKDVHWGDEYSTDPLSNVSVNYELVGTPENASGIVSGDVVVNYYYRLKGASLTVHHYIEGTTNELADSTIKPVHWGDNYTTEPSDKIDINYELVGTPNNASGTIASNSVVVTYYYRLKSATLTVHHYIEGTTKELADTESYDKKWTDEYSTKPSDKININYELVETPSNAKGIISGDTLVTYYYRLKSSTLIVHHYIEGTTTKLVETESYDKKWTDEYTTSPSKSINNNYELSITPDNATGTIDKELVVITYYYRLKSGKLMVHHYVEGTTKELADTESYDKKWTDEYSTKPSDKINNNYELVETPSNAIGIISGDVTVVYYYRLKSAKLIVHHYVEGTTNELAATEIYDKRWTDEYTTSPSDKVSTNYELVSTPDNSSGIISGDVEVIYYYRLKKSNLIVKYIDKDTNKVLAEEINKVVYYGEEYTTEESPLVTANYELHSKSENYEGIVSTDKIEVIYYYQKKDSELSTKITKEGPEEITDKKSSNKYTITYEANIDVYIGDAKITITDKLPYKIDEEKSLLDEGIYNEEDKTITWIIEEKDINASIDSRKIEIIKNIELVYTDIDSEERTMSNTVVGIIELDNNDREVESQKVTYIKIPGKIIVHHYLTGTEEKVVEDEETEDLVGEMYISSPITKEGYKLVKEPDDKNHKYKDELTEVIYEYERIKYDIVTKVEGDSLGGTITGSESIYHGEDSTENNIIITPDEGFEVSKIIINGEEVEIDECRNGCVLGAFINITSNQEVVVIFSKKVENPNTKTFGSSIIKILLILFGILFIFTKIYKKRVQHV